MNFPIDYLGIYSEIQKLKKRIDILERNVEYKIIPDGPDNPMDE